MYVNGGLNFDVKIVT